MYIEQLYTNCLSEATYFIESNGEVAVIDPLRDIDKYIQLAEQKNAVIKYIFETHFHADFVSGHIDLAKKTGAQIIYGPDAETGFEKYSAKDQERFTLGNVQFQAIHTPGHTLESTCYLLYDEHQQPHALFTGDTLFVGDVGRPDLFSGNLSKEALAGYLYESLQKIKQLAPEVKVYPAHGPGSSCGKNLGPNTFSTIGEEIATNYALQPQTKEAFITAVTEGLSTPPVYFPVNAALNKNGYENIDNIMNKGLTALSIEAFKKEIEDDAIILDTRNATEFTQGFIPNAISIGLEGRFAEWAGVLLPFHHKLVLITDIGKEEETITRLTRVGFDQIIGYLAGSYQAWVDAGEKIDLIIDVEPDELKMDMNYDTRLVILDVRKELEFESGHVQTAVNIPLQTMNDVAVLSNIEDNDNVYIHCAGGYRSVIAASIMKKQGFHNIRNVLGGYDQIKLVPEMPLVAAKEVLN
ncbi:MAG: MBL fold metallo-hydrolase [Bacteroidetes bacterium]|nr:MBL fold metallo-hydrolase [Bacteroidota bacterium]MBK7588944.1 MBL fold metallo-hydrolase [Bacteroidota bacterium]MBK8330547.1 MBL fold metallo-hydrolase [Bacteroidota bacterium]